MYDVLRGIYAAVITPYDQSGRPDPDQLAGCLAHLAQGGCHGALLAGTTGEGPSLSVEERAGLFAAAASHRNGLKLLGGTGASSLPDVVTLTRAAYDVGLDGVVIVPPFFYGSADDSGLFDFYAEVIRQAVPDNGAVLLYHNPGVCGVGLSPELIARLLDAFPAQIVGIKDSSYNWEYTRTLLERFPGFLVFTGDAGSLAQTLAAGGAGSITLVSNAFPSLGRDVFDCHMQGKPTAEAQTRLSNAQAQFAGLPRIAALKLVLQAGRIITSISVRPPLRPLTLEEEVMLKERFLLDLRIPRAIRFQDLQTGSSEEGA